MSININFKTLQIEEFAGTCRPDQVYVTTNEMNIEKILSKIQSIESFGNTLLGVSGLFNLDVASVRQNIQTIIIFDRSKKVQDFWTNLENIIINYEYQEAIKKVYELISCNADIYFKPSKYIGDTQSVANYYIRQLSDSIRQQISFMSKESRYDKIKQIFLNNQFQFLRLDLNNSDSFIKLYQFFERNNLSVDILYSSNVRNYCNPASYVLSLSKFIIRQRTIVIDTKTPTILTGNLLQQRIRIQSQTPLKEFLLKNE